MLSVSKNTAALILAAMLFLLAGLLWFGVLPVFEMDKRLFCGPLETASCQSIMYDIAGLRVSAYVFMAIGFVLIGAAMQKYILLDRDEETRCNNQRATF